VSGRPSSSSSSRESRACDCDETADKQNVVHQDGIERTEQGYRFEFAPLRGLSGELTVEQIAVHVEPGR
jgi:hypothetical protein